MNTCLVALMLCCALALSSAQTATSIPFGGFTSPPPTLNAASAGQVITSVSQITSFSFWVANLGTSTQPGSASIARLDTGAVLQTVSVPLPPTPFIYTLVTAIFNLENLDPFSNYVIYLTFPPSAFNLYQIYTTDAPSSPGGYVSRVSPSSAWTTSNKNAAFNLITTNILNLPNVNYAEGHGNYSWACIFHTVYSGVQVNWQNLTINTGYFKKATSTLMKGTCDPTLYWAPYGTAAGCGFENRYALIDLRGTPYAVNEAFITVGYYAGGDITYSNNNQTVNLRGTGDCGFTVSATAWANLNEYDATVVGGFHIHLRKIL